jgi:hypothetical protein
VKLSGRDKERWKKWMREGVEGIVSEQEKKVEDGEKKIKGVT